MTQTFVWSPPGLYSITVLLLLCCVPRSWTEPKYLSTIEVPQHQSTTVPRYCQYQSTRELAPSVIRWLLSSPVKKSSCLIYLWHFWICSACHQTVICVIKLMSTTMWPATAFRRRVCFWIIFFLLTWSRLWLLPPTTICFPFFGRIQRRPSITSRCWKMLLHL